MSCSADQVVREGSTFVYMARIHGATDAAITQSTVATITRTIAVVETDTAGSPTSLTVAAVVYNTLQTGNGWDEDEDGFNFRDVIDLNGTSYENQNLQIQYRLVGSPDTGGHHLNWDKEVFVKRLI